MFTSTTAPAAPQAASLHAAFCDRVLPTVERVARFAFRHLTNRPDDQQDKVQEVIGVAWGWFERLARRGKDAAAFPSALATYAAKHVKNGRRLCGQESSKDVLSETARRRRGFRVESLPDATRTSHDRLYASPSGQKLQDVYEERLRDDTLTPILDQVAFRIDFPAWLVTLSHRNRDIVEVMALSHGTGHLAARFGISPGRVSQLRREFCEGWQRFHKEVD